MHVTPFSAATISLSLVIPIHSHQGPRRTAQVSDGGLEGHLTPF